MLHVHAHVHGVVLLFPRTVGGRGVARELLAYFPGTLLASVCMLTFLNKNRLFLPVSDAMDYVSDNFGAAAATAALHNLHARGS